MNKLTIPDLHLALTDLLTRRTHPLRQLTMGAVYEDALRAQLAKLTALPETQQDQGRHLAAELKETDTRHDALGIAISLTLDAYARSPLTSDDLKAAAERIRAAFIPTRAELNAPYAEEANRARQRADRLTERDADLALFPLADTTTLRDWVAAFLASADSLYDLLQQRARLNQEANAPSEPLLAGPVRSETVGLLGRIRSALADDVAYAGLAPDTDGALFGFVDLLQSMRVENASGRRDGLGDEGGAVEA